MCLYSCGPVGCVEILSQCLSVLTGQREKKICISGERETEHVLIYGKGVLGRG